MVFDQISKPYPPSLIIHVLTSINNNEYLEYSLQSTGISILRRNTTSIQASEIKTDIVQREYIVERWFLHVWAIPFDDH